MKTGKTGDLFLLGGSGAIGTCLRKYFDTHGYKYESSSSNDLKISNTNHDEICHRILERSPSMIVNLAGIVREKTDALPKEDVLDLNGRFAREAASFFSAQGVPFIQISTDCVFKGNAGPYMESSACDAEDLYGMSKAQGESIDAMVVRGSFLTPSTGAMKVGFLDWVIGKKGTTLPAFTNVFWNGITCGTLAEAIIQIELCSLFQKGVFHLSSSRAISRYNLIETMNRVFDLDLNLIPEESPSPISRVLINSRAHFLAELLDVPIHRQLEQLKPLLNY